MCARARVTAEAVDAQGVSRVVLLVEHNRAEVEQHREQVLAAQQARRHAGPDERSESGRRSIRDREAIEA